MAVGVIYRDASVVTARPVVPPPIAEYSPPDALVAGSQLNQAAVGGPYKATELDSGSSLNKSRVGAPWPAIIDGGLKFFIRWRRNNLRAVSTHNVVGNYGEVSSTANYQFRATEFPGGLAGMPLSNVRGNRSEWNNLIPIIYGLRVLNPVSGGSDNFQVQPAKVVSQMTRTTQFTPTGTASLSMKGEVTS